MKKMAVIVAGGAGKRMGNNIPKQFILLHGKPLLWHTLQRFLHAYDDMQIILVLPKEYRHHYITDTLDTKRITIATGGETRFHSVQNGLQHIKEETIIFVHDAVRCLVSVDLIRRCYEQAVIVGSAIPVVPVTDSLRIEKNNGHTVIDRQMVRIVQTPQTFKSNILLPAFQQPCSDAFTDEATVVEACGNTVFLIEGEYSNIKITRPIDLLIAEKFLSDPSTF